MDLLFNPAKFFYDLIAIAANLINSVVQVCGKICGIPDKNGNNFLSDLVDPKSASGETLYLIFVVLALFTMLVSTCAAIYESFKVKGMEGMAMHKPYIDVCKALCHMIFVCGLFSVAILLIGEVGILFQGLFEGGAQLGSNVLKGCFDVKAVPESELTKFNALWTGSSIPSWSAISGALDGSGVSAGDAFNVWQGFISVGVLIGPLMGITVYMAKRLINIALLYAVSPISFAMYPVDDGHAKSEWYKDMKGAMLGGVIMMVMLSIFVFFSSAINATKILEDTLMDGIVKAIITGSGVAVLLSLTKQILKYLGCDDALLANLNSVSPMRAIKAVGSGIKKVKNIGKSKNSKDSGAEDKSSGNEQKQLESKTKNIERTRQKYNSQRKSGGGSSAGSGGGSSAGSGGGSKGESGGAPSKVKRENKFGTMKPKTSTVPEDIKIVDKGKNKSRKTNKSEGKQEKTSTKKGNKDISAFSAALDKFGRQISKTMKPKQDSNGKATVKIKKERKINKNVLNKIDKKETTAIAVNVKKGNKTSKIKVDNKVNNTLKNKIDINAKGGQAQNVKNDLKRVERQLNDNIARTRRINSRLVAMPRKIADSVNRKIKK